jgi:hypothetical protein
MPPSRVWRQNAVAIVGATSGGMVKFPSFVQLFRVGMKESGPEGRRRMLPVASAEWQS